MTDINNTTVGFEQIAPNAFRTFRKLHDPNEDINKSFVQKKLSNFIDIYSEFTKSNSIDSSKNPVINIEHDTPKHDTPKIDYIPEEGDNFFERFDKMNSDTFDLYGLENKLKLPSDKENFNYLRKSIHNYKDILDYISKNDYRDINILFINSVRIGIIRNVRALLPIVLQQKNDSRVIIMNAYGMALQYAHLDILRVLDSLGLNLNHDDYIIHAIITGWTETVKYLIDEKKANILNNKDLLMLTCNEHDNLDILKILFESNTLNKSDLQELIEICVSKSYTKCATFLIQIPVSDKVVEIIPLKESELIQDEFEYWSYSDDDLENYTFEL
jgi:hypothetical protein